ncbi:GNAT family N-acetyltransferase [Streptomyces sp. NPDC021020]|uniref:GNAT family N-acetyltransferase n=1 Tax=Streptomyces sp. NPDC021020 TaxID=3365109 RepID=UPI0037B71EB3
MSEAHGTTLVRWPAEGPSDEALSALLAAYHLRTESEKGAPVADVEGLPSRYRAEVEAPRAAFAGDTVLVAMSAGTAAGCVVVTAPEAGRSEVKRLWTDPAFRGRGIASALLAAAFAHSAAAGATSVRLSVWSWREGAIALYQRLGFAVVTSWDERDELVCMERQLAP